MYYTFSFCYSQLDKIEKELAGCVAYLLTFNRMNTKNNLDIWDCPLVLRSAWYSAMTVDVFAQLIGNSIGAIYLTQIQPEGAV